MSPHWKYELDNELIVMVCHKDLKPLPKDNAGEILAYYNKGTISEQGRSWVCWGDLRTEYIKTDDLRAYLRGEPIGPAGRTKAHLRLIASNSRSTLRHRRPLAGHDAA